MAVAVTGAQGSAGPVAGEGLLSSGSLLGSDPRKGWPQAPAPAPCPLPALAPWLLPSGHAAKGRGDVSPGCRRAGAAAVLQLARGWPRPGQDPWDTPGCSARSQERMGRSLQGRGQPSPGLGTRITWCQQVPAGGCDEAFGVVQQGVRGLGEGTGLHVGKPGGFGGLCWKLCPEQEPCLSPGSACQPPALLTFTSGC